MATTRCVIFLALILFFLLFLPFFGEMVSLPSSVKVLIVGIDGADWNVVNPMMSQGKLPNFSSLQEGGATASLRTLFPLRSPLIWTSVATGKTAEKHGIHDFFVERGKSDPVPVTQNMRKVKAFWNILSEKGTRVGVVGWQVTWPVEEVNGFMVSSYLGYVHRKNRERTLKLPQKGTIVEDVPHQFYPENLASLLLPMKRPPSDIPDGDLRSFLDELPSPALAESPLVANQMENLRWIFSTDEAYAKIGLYLMRRCRPEVLAVYFAGVDVCGHRFWKYYDAASPYWQADPWPEEEQRVFKDTLEGYYSYMDGVLGDYLRAIREDTLVFVLSDHGMQGKKFSGQAAPSGEHRNEALLLLKGPGVKRGVQIQGSVLDITPTLLYYLNLPVAEDMDGGILKEAFEEEYLAAHPESLIPTYESKKKPVIDENGKRSLVDLQIEEHLRSLGYIE